MAAVLPVTAAIRGSAFPESQASDDGRRWRRVNRRPQSARSSRRGPAGSPPMRNSDSRAPTRASAKTCRVTTAAAVRARPERWHSVILVTRDLQCEQPAGLPIPWCPQGSSNLSVSRPRRTSRRLLPLRVRLMAEWRLLVWHSTSSEPCGPTSVPPKSTRIQTPLLHSLLHSAFQDISTQVELWPLTCGFFGGR